MEPAGSGDNVCVSVPHTTALETESGFCYNCHDRDWQDRPSPQWTHTLPRPQEVVMLTRILPYEQSRASALDLG